jgi:chloramphenicol 3-O phosphotransferase
LEDFINEKSMPGNVILLNGCSSAGKTTLALELQKLSEEHFQYIALDQFRDGLPPSLRGLNSPEQDPGYRGLNVVPEIKDGKLVTSIKFGDYGEKVLKVMRRTVSQLARAGCSVVVDDILFEKKYLIDYANVLEPNTSWFVAVKCDLDIVRAREAQRAGRFPGTADSHYDSIHEHGVPYDIEVNTSRTCASALATEIIEGMKSPPHAFSSLIDD